LILDEPLSGLDPIGRRDVRDIILTRAAAGTTVFFSSHIIPDVEMICDRVAIIVDGVVRTIGAVSELVSGVAATYEATFVGAAPSELKTPLEGQHVGSGASWVRVSTENLDRLNRELAGLGAHVVSLNPVRASLEDLLMRHYEETGS
jgi:ABC-2 type transport system ATP-binding protein